MPRQAPRDAAIRINTDVVFRELEGEMVLLNLASGVYFGLDPVGTRIWGLIAEQRSAAEIVRVLTAEYEVDAKTCEADLWTLLDTLAANELIAPSDAPAR
jgi:Coenzyme PQQ synthesis protein D (PqqD)